MAMANPSRRTIDFLQRLYAHRTLLNPIKPNSNLSQIYQIPHCTTSSSIFSRILTQNYTSLSQSHNGLHGRFCSWVSHSGVSVTVSRRIATQNLTKLQSLGLGIKGLGPVRLFSTKFGSNLGKSAVEKPLNVVKSVISRYREVVGLQIEAFWKRNYMIVVGAGALVVCMLLWRLMFSIADMTVGISEGLAKYGFLALATAMVSFAIMYLRSRFTVNPDKVYRMAMRKLNASPAILEVMGAPLTGTDVRAYVMSGGGPKLKDFKFRLGGKRCFLIFPIRGSEKRGLVSVEVKKKKGQHDMKLLAVDIPMASGPDQRLFVIGDDKEYRVGGGLISELRDPIVAAMAAEKEFDYLDEKEEEEDEQREKEEAERKQKEEEERAIEEEMRRREEAERQKLIEEEEKKLEKSNS
ncbi:import inner membrane translocase subunit [Rhynchospora pubera]|uniref:Import inner membrane translocase subunit n=1 Tax=Rhynchospora pubera TaxID=906938 RepID=A0AAV8EU83_9POAL|nr:import inner membrane translocase subunit [Rhynchospora pubera]